jgi:two-component system sensor kinase FixL
MSVSKDDANKTKPQLIQELSLLKRQLARLGQAVPGSSGGPVTDGPKDGVSRTHQQQALLSKAFDLTSDAIIFVDEKLRISHFNQGAEQIFGYSAEEIIGQALNTLVPEALRSHHNTYARDYARSQDPSRFMNDRAAVMGQKKDGSVFPAKVTITRIKHQGETILTAFLRDISDYKEIEDANKLIEAELAHVSRVGMMAEVSSSLAHELNQPLAAMLTNAQVLQRLNKRAAAKLENADDIITDLIDDAHRAAEIIKRTRALLKPGPSKLEVIDLNTIVTDVERLLGSEIIMRQISLRTELANDLSAVLADRIQLQQVLVNFMTNAFDAMQEVDPDERHILIRTRQLNSIAAEVCVIDNGIGLQPEKLHQIFDPFYTTKKDGLGMGLAISRTLLQAQGGDVWAESAPDGGAALYFSIKLAVEADYQVEAEGGGIADDEMTAGQDDPATVYIVDDDSSVRKAMRRLVGAAGYAVETFDSANAFLQQSDLNAPCCLLVDLHMPSVTGLDLQKQLNQRDYTIPVIFITGAGNTEAGVQAIKQGAVDFLSKPVDKEALLASIGRAIKKDRAALVQYKQRVSVNERLSKLTAREREVLDLVVTGLMNKQIGYELGITEKTVKAHRGQMMRKMEARSLAGLVHLVESTIGNPPPDV